MQSYEILNRILYTSLSQPQFSCKVYAANFLNFLFHANCLLKVLNETVTLAICQLLFSPVNRLNVTSIIPRYCLRWCHCTAKVCQEHQQVPFISFSLSLAKFSPSLNFPISCNFRILYSPLLRRQEEQFLWIKHKSLEICWPAPILEICTTRCIIEQELKSQRELARCLRQQLAQHISNLN